MKVIISVIIVVLMSNNFCSSQDLELTKQKAGEIQIDMHANEIYSSLGKEKTELIDLFIEGMYSPALVILNDRSENSLIVELVCDKVWRITVYAKNYKTDKGICVGSTLGDLRKRYRVDSIEVGEVGIFAYVEDLDMSFVLDFTGPLSENFDPSKINSNVRIVKILVL